jgi:vancomycin aglycone glucosyltransferase
MRRVLLTAMGSIGEVQPLLALALRLRAAGLQVRLCVSAEFHSRVESFGFPVMPIASYPWRQAVPDRGASPQQRRELAEATVADQFSALSAAALDCDVIVAAAVLAEVLPVARSVAELLGIGYVFAAFCPAYLPSPHQPPRR